MLSRLRRAGRELLGPSSPRSRPAPASTPVLPQPPTPVPETFDSSCPPGPILKLDCCPVCGSADATPHVCRYNKFITYERMPDAAAPRYEFALCHACGIDDCPDRLSPTGRPEGAGAPAAAVSILAPTALYGRRPKKTRRTRCEVSSLMASIAPAAV